MCLNHHSQYVFCIFSFWRFFSLCETMLHWFPWLFLKISADLAPSWLCFCMRFLLTTLHTFWLSFSLVLAHFCRPLDFLSAAFGGLPLRTQRSCWRQVGSKLASFLHNIFDYYFAYLLVAILARLGLLLALTWLPFGCLWRPFGFQNAIQRPSSVQLGSKSGTCLKFAFKILLFGSLKLIKCAWTLIPSTFLIYLAFGASSRFVRPCFPWLFLKFSADLAPSWVFLCYFCVLLCIPFGCHFHSSWLIFAAHLASFRLPLAGFCH